MRNKTDTFKTNHINHRLHLRVSLTKLSLSGNKFRSVPAEIANLTSNRKNIYRTALFLNGDLQLLNADLKTLLIDNNKFLNTLLNVTSLQSLQILSVGGCALKVMDPNIHALT